jgi:hypothetical protein
MGSYDDETITMTGKVSEKFHSDLARAVVVHGVSCVFK